MHGKKQLQSEITAVNKKSLKAKNNILGKHASHWNNCINAKVPRYQWHWLEIISSQNRAVI